MRQDKDGYLFVLSDDERYRYPPHVVQQRVLADIHFCADILSRFDPSASRDNSYSFPSIRTEISEYAIFISGFYAASFPLYRREE